MAVTKTVTVTVTAPGGAIAVRRNAARRPNSRHTNPRNTRALVAASAARRHRIGGPRRSERRKVVLCRTFDVTSAAPLRSRVDPERTRSGAPRCVAAQALRPTHEHHAASTLARTQQPTRERGGSRTSTAPHLSPARAQRPRTVTHSSAVWKLPPAAAPVPPTHKRSTRRRAQSESQS